MRIQRWIKVFVTVLVLAVVIGAAVTPSVREQLEERAKTLRQWLGMDSAAQDSDAIYWCPMHPQIKRPRPDTCPICNMALVELEGGTRANAPDSLMLTVQQVQQAGVVTEPVLRRSLYREIDTTGRLDYDERRLATITSWMKGKSRVEKLPGEL